MGVHSPIGAAFHTSDAAGEGESKGWTTALPSLTQGAVPSRECTLAYAFPIPL